MIRTRVNTRRKLPQGALVRVAERIQQTCGRSLGRPSSARGVDQGGRTRRAAVVRGEWRLVKRFERYLVAKGRTVGRTKFSALRLRPSKACEGQGTGKPSGDQDGDLPAGRLLPFIRPTPRTTCPPAGTAGRGLESSAGVSKISVIWLKEGLHRQRPGPAHLVARDRRLGIFTALRA